MSFAKRSFHKSMFSHTTINYNVLNYASVLLILFMQNINNVFALHVAITFFASCLAGSKQKLLC